MMCRIHGMDTRQLFQTNCEDSGVQPTTPCASLVLKLLPSTVRCCCAIVAVASNTRIRPCFGVMFQFCQDMANAEATVILAAICARFDVALAPGQVRGTIGWGLGLGLHRFLFLSTCCWLWCRLQCNTLSMMRNTELVTFFCRSGCGTSWRTLHAQESLAFLSEKLSYVPIGARCVATQRRRSFVQRFSAET